MKAIDPDSCLGTIIGCVVVVVVFVWLLWVLAASGH